MHWEARAALWTLLHTEVPGSEQPCRGFCVKQLRVRSRCRGRDRDKVRIYTGEGGLATSWSVSQKEVQILSLCLSVSVSISVCLSLFLTYTHTLVDTCRDRNRLEQDISTNTNAILIRNQSEQRGALACCKEVGVLFYGPPPPSSPVFADSVGTPAWLPTST